MEEKTILRTDTPDVHDPKLAGTREFLRNQGVPQSGMTAESAEVVQPSFIEEQPQPQRVRDRNGAKIRIVIADDHAILRESVSALLATQPDFEVVGRSGNGQEALNLVREQALSKIGAAILGNFGGQDRGITPEDVNAFSGALKKLGKPADIKIYPDAGHAFENPDNKAGYRAEDTADAKQRYENFFDATLKK